MSDLSNECEAGEEEEIRNFFLMSCCSSVIEGLFMWPALHDSL